VLVDTVAIRWCESTGLLCDVRVCAQQEYREQQRKAYMSNMFYVECTCIRVHKCGE
jgi:hypothetical protein